MALVACPDCGKHHSDLAPACPQCGRPVFQPKAASLGRTTSRQAHHRQRREAGSPLLWIGLSAGGCTALCLGGVVLFIFWQMLVGYLQFRSF